MLDAATQLLEDRPRPRHVRFGAAGEAEELPLLGRPGRPADGTLDEHRAAGANAVGERALGLRADRAHLDEELSLDVAGEQATRAAVRRVDRGGVGEDRDDRLRARGERLRCRGDLRARGGERRGLRRGPIPDRDLVTLAEEPGGDGRTHAAGACDADAHDRVSWKSAKERGMLARGISRAAQQSVHVDTRATLEVQ